MIEKRYDTLEGLSAPILVYENYDEAEKVEAGGLLREANNNMAYRGVLPAVRDLICTIVEEASGVEREKKVVGKTKAGKDIIQWEADGRYVKRAMAAKGWDDLTQFQTQLEEQCRNYKESEDVNAMAAPLAVDVKGREYAAKGPKRLAAIYKITAARVLAANSVDAFNSKRLVDIGKTFVPTGDTSKMFDATFEDNGSTKKVSVSDKDAEALGWMVKEWNDWRSKQELANI